MKFSTESFTLVRCPMDMQTGEDMESCSYALFPGITMAQSEPELVVKLYDSLRNQRPDTGMFLYDGYGSDPLLNRKYQQRLLTRWRNLGKPTIILTSPEDKRFFRGHLGEIPTVSLYDELLAFGISGGCNKELYQLIEPDYSSSAVMHSDTNADCSSNFSKSVQELAESMGVYLVDDSNADEYHVSLDQVPYLTSSMALRNQLKKDGKSAVHILELIYGMGESNRHLAHEHSEGHDHDAPPEIRIADAGEEENAALARLYNSEAQKKNLQDLHDILLSFFWNE